MKYFKCTLYTGIYWISYNKTKCKNLYILYNYNYASWIFSRI